VVWVIRTSLLWSLCGSVVLICIGLFYGSHTGLFYRSFFCKFRHQSTPPGDCLHSLLGNPIHMSCSTFILLFLICLFSHIDSSFHTSVQIYVSFPNLFMSFFQIDLGLFCMSLFTYLIIFPHLCAAASTAISGIGIKSLFSKLIQVSFIGLFSHIYQSFHTSMRLSSTANSIIFLIGLSAKFYLSLFFKTVSTC